MRFFLLVVLLVAVQNAGAVGFDVGVSLSPSENSIEVSVPFIDVAIEKGEDLVFPITFFNQREEPQEFSIETRPNFVSVSADKGKFILEPEGDVTFNVLLDSKGLDPGVYIGNVEINGEEVYDVPVILQIENKLTFDVDTDIPLKYLAIEPGENLVAGFRFYNLKSRKDFNAIADFSVMDLNGEIIDEDSQNIEVTFGSSVEIKKTFETADIKTGSYVLGVSVRQNDFVGTDATLFEVKQKVDLSPDNRNEVYLYISSVIIIVLILSFLVINYYWKRRVVSDSKYWSQRLRDVNKVKTSDIAREIGKLENQRNLLEEAYKKGYVRKTSYNESLKNINELLRKLKKRL